MNSHAYITQQAQINSQPHSYEKPNIQFLTLNPTEHNFIAGFFQVKSINNLSLLSWPSQKAILKLSKGNPDLPITNLQQLYGIIKNEPLTLNIFIHLIHQLWMEITPRNLVNDINLICPQYTEKIIYIVKNKQPELQDFDTIPLGTCCDLVLNTSFSTKTNINFFSTPHEEPFSSHSNYQMANIEQS